MIKPIPIFVINLKKDTQKKNKISAMLDSLGLEFDIFEAVDGKKLTVDEVNEIYQYKKSIHKRKIFAGEIGCAMSHIGIYKKLLKERIKQAIILEDDVIINADFSNAITLINHLPDDWELVLFGHSDAKERQRHFCKVNIPLKNNTTQFLLGKPIVTVGGTYGYLINQNGVKKLLTNISDKLCQPIDSYTGNYTIINLYGIYPNPIRVDFSLESSNNIQQKKHNKFHQKISDFNRNRKLNRTWTINCAVKIIVYKISRLLIYFFKH